ncbi:MAG TPA: response regulator transcription factor [Steroidobacteraceae bacterium]|nr:response regulator transcription factor [Steroidobacteraceae bacterium]
MASVLIADDHAMLRSGLRHFLEQDAAITAIAESATAAETLAQLRAAPFDLLILDINMTDRSGIDILRQVRVSHPDTRVLVLSGFSERQYAVNVLRAGACGYLAKDQAPEEVLRAVHTVLDGKHYFSGALSDVLSSEPAESYDQPLHAALSPREFQILCKIARGRSVSQIAQDLSISVKTVSTYRARILEKMHMDSNAALTAYALRNELIQ